MKFIKEHDMVRINEILHCNPEQNTHEELHLLKSISGRIYDNWLASGCHDSDRAEYLADRLLVEQTMLKARMGIIEQESHEFDKEA